MRQATAATATTRPPTSSSGHTGNGSTAAVLTSLAPLAVTVEQAAAMLGVCRTVMYRLVMRGDVLSFKVGASRRIPVEALRAYVARQVDA